MQGCVDYEFRTTAVSELHDDESFTGIAEWIQGARQYYIQRFEDRDSVFRSGFHTPPEEVLHRWLALVKPHVKFAALRGM